MIMRKPFLQNPYPDSDGQPMAENPLQFEWIVTLKGGCEALFADRDDVYVAGDHLIYPEKAKPGEEENVFRIAPDVYVAFGRPKEYRGSYKVWQEDGIFPQVVFEVWSPGNRQQQMDEKRAAYEKYGAEEYYIVYPEHPAFVEVWIRKAGKLVRVEDVDSWVSPRLGIRFKITMGQLTVVGPDGKPFLTFLELHKQSTEQEQRAEAEKQRAEAEKQRAEQEAKRAEQEAKRAETEKQRAEQEAKRAEAEKQRAETAEQRAAKLAAKLRELGIDPNTT